MRITLLRFCPSFSTRPQQEVARKAATPPRPWPRCRMRKQRWLPHLRTGCTRQCQTHTGAKGIRMDGCDDDFLVNSCVVGTPRIVPKADAARPRKPHTANSARDHGAELCLYHGARCRLEVLLCVECRGPSRREDVVRTRARCLVLTPRTAR